MIYNKIFLFTLSFVIVSNIDAAIKPIKGCTIKYPSKIFFIDNKVQNLNNSIDSYGCKKETVNLFKNFISQSRGEIKKSTWNHFIKNYKKNKNYEEILNLNQKKLQISSLNSFIKNKTTKEDNIFVENINLMNNKSLIDLKHNESLTLDCSNCDSVGTKNIKLNIVSENVVKKSLWIKADFYKKQKALVASQDLGAFNKKLKGKFQEKNVKLKEYKNLFLSKNDLKFYKLNKKLKKHSPLLKNDLTPLKIVKSYSFVKVILKSNGLKIKSTAKSLESGTIGEKIRLQSLKNKKVFEAIVTNFNQAEVTL